MNAFVYVVSVTGKNIYDGCCIQYVIKSMRDLDKVRRRLKKVYGVEFEELSSCFTSSWWKFTNITNDDDINLLVERVEILD